MKKFDKMAAMARAEREEPARAEAEQDQAYRMASFLALGDVESLRRELGAMPKDAQGDAACAVFETAMVSVALSPAADSSRALWTAMMEAFAQARSPEVFTMACSSLRAAAWKLRYAAREEGGDGYDHSWAARLLGVGPSRAPGQGVGEGQGASHDAKAALAGLVWLCEALPGVAAGYGVGVARAVEAGLPDPAGLGVPIVMDLYRAVALERPGEAALELAVAWEPLVAGLAGCPPALIQEMVERGPTYGFPESVWPRVRALAEAREIDASACAVHGGARRSMAL